MSEWHRPLLLTALIGLLAACDAPWDAAADDGSAPRDWETLSLSRRPAGEQSLAVELEYGAGHLAIRPGTAETLYQARLRYDARTFTPETSYDDGRLAISLTGQVRGRRVEAARLDLELSPALPLDLKLEFGAADAEIDLGGLQVQRLAISTGASRTQLTFSEPNRSTAQSLSLQVGAAKFVAEGLGNANASELTVEGGVGDIDLDFTGELAQDMSVEVDMGLGRLGLRVPRDVGVRIERDGMLASVRGDGLIRTDNVYYSTNYDAAERRLRFDVDAALNTIDVIWVDGRANAP